ncbi:MAG: ABC transporter ATP-binding protein [Saprospiraceae bacterium]|nr:ABC transporter ATP-binding protein [Saprospiraceae bacterium]
MAKKLRSLGDSNTIGFRESLLALKNIPRFFVEIYKSGPQIFTANLISRFLTSFSPIIKLWVGKLIIDEVILQAQTENGDLNQLWVLIAIEFGVFIITDLLNRGTNLTDGLLGDLYSNASSVKIIQKIDEVSISQLENADFYDKLERARTQTNSRVNLMSNALSQIQDIIAISSLIVALIYFEPWLILLLIISIIPSFLNEYKFSSNQYSIARSWTAERRELDYIRFIGANDRTAKEVKLFGLSKYLADRFAFLSDSYYKINKKLSVKRSLLGSLFGIIGSLSYYGAYVLIVYRAVNGIITIGDLTFLSGSYNRLQTKLQGVFSKFTRISQSALYLQDYFDFIDIKGLNNEGSKQIKMPSTIKEGFVFEDVTFSYPGSDNLVLDGVTFKLNLGEKLAFVGENGAGKTTLIKLLLRFYQPNSGTIYLDSINISDYDINEYQRYFGVIFQDFIRYEFSVKENIAVGDIMERENFEKIKAAAELSLADEVVNEMKNGYEQQLGRRFSNGKNLSGGQWQKIALARAYMKDAEVIILDEPTSALDARAEYEAFQRFIGLTKGKTSIIISHRFSTVRMADRIIVLKNGKILENGSHNELMANKALYAELFDLQAAGYK